MKTIMKVLLSAGIAVLMVPMAFAGATQPAEVDVDLVNNTASGDMISARFAEGEDVFIGCGIRNFEFADGTIFEFGFCQAEDADGERAFCNTESPGLLDAMKAISDYSFVTFSFNVEIDDEGNEFNTCSRIGNSTQSFYIPNFKLKKN